MEKQKCKRVALFQLKWVRFLVLIELLLSTFVTSATGFDFVDDNKLSTIKRRPPGPLRARPSPIFSRQSLDLGQSGSLEGTDVNPNVGMSNVADGSQQSSSTLSEASSTGTDSKNREARGTFLHHSYQKNAKNQGTSGAETADRKHRTSVLSNKKNDGSANLIDYNVNSQPEAQESAMGLNLPKRTTPVDVNNPPPKPKRLKELKRMFSKIASQNAPRRAALAGRSTDVTHSLPNARFGSNTATYSTASAIPTEDVSDATRAGSNSGSDSPTPNVRKTRPQVAPRTTIPVSGPPPPVRLAPGYAYAGVPPSPAPRTRVPRDSTPDSDSDSDSDGYASIDEMRGILQRIAGPSTEGTSAPTYGDIQSYSQWPFPEPPSLPRRNTPTTTTTPEPQDPDFPLYATVYKRKKVEKEGGTSPADAARHSGSSSGSSGDYATTKRISVDIESNPEVELKSIKRRAALANERNSEGENSKTTSNTLATSQGAARQSDADLDKIVPFDTASSGSETSSSDSDDEKENDMASKQTIKGKPRRKGLLTYLVDSLTPSKRREPPHYNPRNEMQGVFDQLFVHKYPTKSYKSGITGSKEWMDPKARLNSVIPVKSEAYKKIQSFLIDLVKMAHTQQIDLIHNPEVFHQPPREGPSLAFGLSVGQISDKLNTVSRMDDAHGAKMHLTSMSLFAGDDTIRFYHNSILVLQLRCRSRPVEYEQLLAILYGIVEKPSRLMTVNLEDVYLILDRRVLQVNLYIGKTMLSILHVRELFASFVLYNHPELYNCRLKNVKPAPITSSDRPVFVYIIRTEYRGAECFPIQGPFESLRKKQKEFLHHMSKLQSLDKVFTLLYPLNSLTEPRINNINLAQKIIYKTIDTEPFALDLHRKIPKEVTNRPSDPFKDSYTPLKSDNAITKWATSCPSLVLVAKNLKISENAAMRLHGVVLGEDPSTIGLHVEIEDTSLPPRKILTGAFKLPSASSIYGYIRVKAKRSRLPEFCAKQGMCEVRSNIYLHKKGQNLLFTPCAGASNRWIKK